MEVKAVFKSLNPTSRSSISGLLSCIIYPLSSHFFFPLSSNLYPPKGQLESNLILRLLSSLIYPHPSFLKVIEFEELSGVIFPQTVVNEIQQSSLKHYRLFQFS